MAYCRELLCTLILGSVLSCPALAGIADPVPATLNGDVPVRHLYSVPGVVKANGLETTFMCTSAETSNTVKIGVELFDRNGGAALNDVTSGNGTGSLSPGGSATISTGLLGGFHSEVVIVGLPVISFGSARILSTSRKVICNAIVLDGSGEPSSMTSLKVVKRVRQIGD